MHYRFGDFLFDDQRFELSREGERIAVRPRVLALLQMLLENRFRLVTKDEIIAEIWGGAVISDSALAVTLRTLRRALDDDGMLIRTIYGKGVRFLGETVAEPSAVDLTAMQDDDAEQEPPEVGRPSIAVLPFRLVGLAGPYATLAEAMPDEVITALAKLRWLFVIARGSCFQFPSYDFTAREVGRKLQVRYCLSGTMEIVGSDMRITVELAETLEQKVVWREDFMADFRGLHEVRQEIVRRIASEIDLRITANELERTRSYMPDDLDAWQNFHVGLARVMAAEIDRYPEARRHFGKALEMDPAFARAKAGMSNTYMLETLFRKDGGKEAASNALHFADAAFQDDPLDPYCTLMQARAELLHKRYDSGFAGLERAIELSPSYSIAWSDLARMQVLFGKTAEARQSIETALKLNPVDPYNHTSYINLSLIELQEGNFAKAAKVARESRHLKFRSFDDQICSLLAFHFGQEKDLAKREALEIRRTYSGLSLAEYLTPIPFLTDDLKTAIGDVFRIYRLEK